MRQRSNSLIAVLLIVAVSATVSITALWTSTPVEMADRIVRSDVKGYYGHLQALFIRGDLGHEAEVWEYVRYTPGGTLNKYFCGTAIMMAPWFAIGHAFALADPSAARDGLSVHEMRALSVGAWVYLLIGLLAIRAMLLRMGVRENVVLWTILALGLGTQLMQYAAMQPGWSHVHSFCCISLFLLVARRMADGGSSWLAVAMAVLLGLIVLIRPVNGLVLLAIPVVMGRDLGSVIAQAWRHKSVLMIAAIGGLCVVFVQPLLWHAQTGQWFAYGYTGEGFHWDKPEVFKVLFGFRRGLFLWAPVLLIALAGTVHLLMKDRMRGIRLLLWWVGNVYVISAWWIWYYGSGFGARVFVDHYPVLAIPFAMLLNALSHRWWTAMRAFIVLCCTLLLFQMWQYHAFILHHESMDRAKYAHTFLRWGDEHRGVLGGNYQAPPFSPNGMEVVLEESCDFEHPCSHWGGAVVTHTRIAFSGSNAGGFTPEREFGLGFATPTGTLPIGRALYLEVGYQRLEPSPGSSRTLLAVTDVVRADGSHAYYEPFRINPMPPKPCQWEQVEYRIPVPPLAAGDRLAFYFWNSERKAHVLIDDVFMRVNAVRAY